MKLISLLNIHVFFGQEIEGSWRLLVNKWGFRLYENTLGTTWPFLIHFGVWKHRFEFFEWIKTKHYWSGSIFLLISGLVMGVNWWTLAYLAPSPHWEFSTSILKLNVKMAPERSGFISCLPLYRITNKLTKMFHQTWKKLW